MFKIICILLTAIFLQTPHVFAEESSPARRYSVYWAGFHVADLVTEIGDKRIDAVIESYGMARKVSKFNSKTHSEYDIKNGEYVPAAFFTEFNLKSNKRTIDIKFQEDGEIEKEAVTPPDNRAKRPAVADNLKKDAVDPLTAVIIARQKVVESLKSGDKKFSLNMYDGRRLSRLDFNVHGQTKETIRDIEHDVVKVTFTRHPIAGYTQNELRRQKEEEPVFTLFLEEDTMLPLKADADAPLGSAVVLLEKECANISSCMVAD